MPILPASPTTPPSRPVSCGRSILSSRSDRQTPDRDGDRSRWVLGPVLGSFYTLLSLFEDKRADNAIFWDTRIIRMTEALFFLVRLYRRLEASDTDVTTIEIRHAGLAGRSLGVAIATVSRREVVPQPKASSPQRFRCHSCSLRQSYRPTSSCAPVDAAPGTCSARGVDKAPSPGRGWRLRHDPRDLLKHFDRPAGRVLRLARKRTAACSDAA